MKVEDTIHRSIIKYPSLYNFGNLKDSRMAVLNHLFFTNGNGYDWKDGELVEYRSEKLKSFKKRVKEKQLKKWLNEDHKDYEDSEAFKRFEEFCKENDLLHHLTKEAKEERKRRRIEENNNRKLHIYPFSKGYFLLGEIPDDVKEDWLDAGYDACVFALNWFEENGSEMDTQPYREGNRDKDPKYVKEWCAGWGLPYDKSWTLREAIGECQKMFLAERKMLLYMWLKETYWPIKKKFEVDK